MSPFQMFYTFLVAEALQWPKERVTSKVAKGIVNLRQKNKKS